MVEWRAERAQEFRSRGGAKEAEGAAFFINLSICQSCLSIQQSIYRPVYLCIYLSLDQSTCEKPSPSIIGEGGMLCLGGPLNFLLNETQRQTDIFLGDKVGGRGRSQS